jgi:3-methyladenine DNA glycosylase AlkD
MGDDLAADIRQAIHQAADGRPPAPDRKFNKGDEYVAYGLKVPELRRVLRPFRPQVKALNLDDRLDVAGELLGAHIGELGHAGIHVLALGVHDLGPQRFDVLDRLADDFRGWSHVDDFCDAVMPPLLRAHRQATLALVARWNAAPNRWKRRASVVTFTRRVGESGEFTDIVLQLCDNLVNDPEDLVQKGVGWALKDNLRPAPERVIAYVKELRRRGVPSTITLYAIRDLKGPQREEVLRVRKA